MLLFSYNEVSVYNEVTNPTALFQVLYSFYTSHSSHKFLPQKPLLLPSDDIRVEYKFLDLYLGRAGNNQFVVHILSSPKEYTPMITSHSYADHYKPPQAVEI